MSHRDTPEEKFKALLVNALNTRGLPGGFYQAVENLQKEEFDRRSMGCFKALINKLSKDQEQKLLR